MKRIEFSHNFTKLHGTTKARLLEWQTKDSDFIDGEAILYDTEYWEGGKRKFYYLKPGLYLRLLLMGENGIPFTTYRKANNENVAKYCDSIGEWFEIVVNEGGKK